MNTGTAFRAVVFDMDGVLVNSAACHRAAFEEVFLPFGVRFDYGQYAGWRTPEVIRHVLASVQPALSKDAVDELSERKSRRAREMIVATDTTVPGCVAVLEQLASSYLLGLASSGSRASVELFLDRNRCRHLFRSVLCGDEVDHAKPYPEIYLRSFETLGAPATLTTVVEDAVSGVQAARAAGAGEVVGITGTVPRQALLAAGAGCVIDALTELPQLLCDNYEPARCN